MWQTHRYLTFNERCNNWRLNNEIFIIIGNATNKIFCSKSNRNIYSCISHELLITSHIWLGVIQVLLGSNEKVHLSMIWIGCYLIPHYADSDSSSIGLVNKTLSHLLKRVMQKAMALYSLQPITFQFAVVRLIWRSNKPILVCVGVKNDFRVYNFIPSSYLFECVANYPKLIRLFLTGCHLLTYIIQWFKDLDSSQVILPAVTVRKGHTVIFLCEGHIVIVLCTWE